MSELPLRFLNCIYSRGGKLPKLNHDNMTKIHGGDKAEIPRHPLLQLHFQDRKLTPHQCFLLGMHF